MDFGFQDALQDKWAEVLDVHLAHMLCALGVRGAADGLRKSVSIRLSKKKIKLSEVRPTVRL